MSALVGYINQSSIKQGIKYAVGVPTTIFGAVAVLELVGGDIFLHVHRSRTWKGTADRIVHAMAYVSLVLSGAVSPIGTWAISKAAGFCFSSAQLDKVFGPNTTFAANWKHPRHVVSLAAVGLALPLLFKRLVVTPVGDHGSETMLQCVTLYTVVTSRPMLHSCNQLFQNLLLMKR